MMAKEPPLPLLRIIGEYNQDIWGFTGTRSGMTEFQTWMSKFILRRGQPKEFHHGGAHGSDTEVHLIWTRTCRHSRARVWPADEVRASMFRGQQRVTVEQVRLPLARNTVITEKVKFMLATPHTEREERSGTWQCIRQAAQRNVPILILWPHSQHITLYRDQKLYRVSYPPRSAEESHSLFT